MNRFESNSERKLATLTKVFLESAYNLTNHPEPLNRLAGRIALIDPLQLHLTRNSKLQRELHGETTWQSEPDDNSVPLELQREQRLDRSLRVGRTLGHLAIDAQFYERTAGDEIDLLLRYTPQRGAHFFQRRGSIDYGTDLPYLASEVSTVNRFVRNIEAGFLHIKPPLSN